MFTEHFLVIVHSITEHFFILLYLRLSNIYLRIEHSFILLFTITEHSIIDYEHYFIPVHTITKYGKLKLDVLLSLVCKSKVFLEFIVVNQMCIII